MPKTNATLVKSTKPRRKRQPHLFETHEFKERLKRSIEKNCRDFNFISNRDEFKFRHTILQLLAPCKKTRGKRGRITRPQNAFILYRKDFQDEIKEKHPDANFEKISQIVGKLWARESDKIKNQYILLADLCGRVHSELFPDYKFKPRPKEGDETEGNIITEEPKEGKGRELPWSPFSSIIAPQTQPSLEEQMLTLSINTPQESYGVTNMLQETQVESQSLERIIEIFDLFQQKEQFIADNFICPNYEMQSMENLPFYSSENASIDTTLTLPFVDTTMLQEFNYPSAELSPIEYNFAIGQENLYNIFFDENNDILL
ncbi:92_t:CDS:1 [Dentiscutata erythropus]|uniref:92_t:CDS:1 n=1 Tax=Dentiscutata erythropus TaxID=1348616 RepID=A0A9N9NFS4_9GLOM|nr:92_t:CDS:1 [Dentiscutata erythropus]